MPPTQGQLQQLPVKVLYQLDSSRTANSFVTVLNERQSVYVHPHRGAYRGNGEELFASCALKAVARAVCFASPELAPMASQPDSSIYVLDPREGLRPRSRSTSPSTHTVHYPVWTGKGLLSWLLAEHDPGKTLAMGRLTRAWEFSASSGSFSLGDDEGGLEGLMAAANAGYEDNEDGLGWGLEIAISLRETKNPPMGRQELHESLERGLGSGEASSPALTNGARHQVQVPLPAAPRSNAQRPEQQQTNQRVERQWSAGPTNAPNPSSSSGPWQQANRVNPPQQNYTRAPSAGPSQPRNPVAPMRAQPEASGSGWQSAPAPIPEMRRQVQRPPGSTPNLNHPSPLATTSHVAAADTVPAELLTQLLPALKQASAGNNLTPELARQIQSNPALLKLLKSMAPTPAIAGRASLQDAKPSPSGSAHLTPMPQSTPAAIPLEAPSGSTAILHSVEPCYNCGTHESTCWRTKKLRDGEQRKVCDECGMYFNEHKRMRPKELWTHLNNEAQRVTPAPELAPPSLPNGPSSDGHPSKRIKLNHTPGPSVGVRSSPRHTKTPNKAQTTPRKASQTNARLPPPPPSPSPRRSTRIAPAAKTPSPRKNRKADPPSSGRTRAGAALTRACGGHDLRSGSSTHSQRDGSTTPTPNGKASRTAPPPAPVHPAEAARNPESNDTQWATDFSAWTTDVPTEGEVDLFDFHFPGEGEVAVGEVQGEGQGQGRGQGEALVMSDDLMALMMSFQATEGR